MARAVGCPVNARGNRTVSAANKIAQANGKLLIARCSLNNGTAQIKMRAQTCTRGCPSKAGFEIAHALEMQIEEMHMEATASRRRRRLPEVSGIRQLSERHNHTTNLSVLKLGTPHDQSKTPCKPKCPAQTRSRYKSCEEVRKLMERRKAQLNRIQSAGQFS